IVFQLTFAAITPALIIGAFMSVQFSAVLLTMVLWFIVLLPADGAWSGTGGSDGYTSAEAAEKLGAMRASVPEGRAP
ncbi:MAG: ammonium transporter, partial [Sulfuritalea sp.]|nr:ammonium transporter [Sulfuritalea sp.]